MRETILKYKLNASAIQQIEMPQGAKILCIQVQNGVPCIWALVDTGSFLTKRTFEIFGTGQAIPDDVIKRNYIGTFQLDNGDLVFHCFEIDSIDSCYINKPI